MFTMIATGIFHMAGHGTVITGKVASGSVRVGQRLRLSSPSSSVTAVAAALERVPGREFVTRAKSGEEIGVLLRDFSPESLSDGIERVEPFGWRVVSLRVSGEASWRNVIQRVLTRRRSEPVAAPRFHFR
jgi:translation elongation factor EF-Tu-like GTPase